jgi:hypothetical protein
VGSPSVAALPELKVFLFQLLRWSLAVNSRSRAYRKISS